MGKLQYITTTHFFPAAVTVTSQDPDFPAPLLSDWTGTHPLARGWHSTTTAPQTLTFAFGGLKAGTWLAVMAANFATVQISVSTNGTTFTPVSGSPFTLTPDLADPEGYTKLFLPQSYSATHGRLVIPTQATLKNTSYFSLGLVLWGDGIVTMSRHFQVPLSIDYVEPEYRAEGTDWLERASAGIRYMTLTPRNRVPNAEVDEWHALRLLPIGARVLGYMNLGRPWEVYIMERDKPLTVTRETLTQQVDTGLRTIA